MTTLLDHLETRPTHRRASTTPAQRLRTTMAAVPGLASPGSASRRR